MGYQYRYPGQLLARVLINKFCATKKAIFPNSRTGPGRLDPAKDWLIRWEGIILGGAFLSGLAGMGLSVYVQERADDICRRVERRDFYDASCRFAGEQLAYIQHSLDFWEPFVQRAAERVAAAQQAQLLQQQQVELLHQQVGHWQSCCKQHKAPAAAPGPSGGAVASEGAMEPSDLSSSGAGPLIEGPVLAPASSSSSSSPRDPAAAAAATPALIFKAGTTKLGANIPAIIQVGTAAGKETAAAGAVPSSLTAAATSSGSISSIVPYVAHVLTLLHPRKLQQAPSRSEARLLPTPGGLVPAPSENSELMSPYALVASQETDPQRLEKCLHAITAALAAFLLLPSPLVAAAAAMEQPLLGSGFQAATAGQSSQVSRGALEGRAETGASSSSRGSTSSASCSKSLLDNHDNCSSSSCQGGGRATGHADSMSTSESIGGSSSSGSSEAAPSCSTAPAGSSNISIYNPLQWYYRWRWRRARQQLAQVEGALALAEAGLLMWQQALEGGQQQVQHLAEQMAVHQQLLLTHYHHLDLWRGLAQRPRSVLVQAGFQPPWAAYEVMGTGSDGSSSGSTSGNTCRRSDNSSDLKPGTGSSADVGNGSAEDVVPTYTQEARGKEQAPAGAANQGSRKGSSKDAAGEERGSSRGRRWQWHVGVLVSIPTWISAELEEQEVEILGGQLLEELIQRLEGNESAADDSWRL